MDVYSHLNSYVVSDNSYTHKKVKPYETKWNISNNMKEFWILYCEHIDEITSHEWNTFPSIMEKGAPYTPINVTMCLKYNTDYKLRIDNECLLAILSNIQYTIKEIYDVQEAQRDQTLSCCFLQNRDVYQDENGDYCNAISFIFPKCVVPISSQLGIFRKRLLDNLLNVSILRFFPIQPKNGVLDDILQQSPPRGDWTLYGSIGSDIGSSMEAVTWYTELPEEELRYNTRYFDIDKYTIDINACDFLMPSMHNDCLRFNFDPTDTHSEHDFWIPMILSIDYCSTRTRVRMTDIPKSVNVEADDNDSDISIAKLLIPMIGIRNEDDWITIGKALYNCVYEPIFPAYEYMGNNEQQAIDIWLHNAAQRGYNPGNLLPLWDTFGHGNYYTLRSIGWFAMTDSLESYKSWHRSWYCKSISLSMEKMSKEHMAFGLSFFKYLWLDFCYAEDASCKVVHANWYKFNRHRWVQIGPTEMNRALDVFRKEVELYGKNLYQKMIDCHDNNQKDIINNKIKKASNIIADYSNDAWKRNVINASKNFFIIPNFDKKIDDNKCLTGVLNGVIEVNDKRAIFRPGRPEDYITKFTSVQYQDLGDNHPSAQEYIRFIHQAFPDEELADTQLRFFSSLLHAVQYKYFYVWTGMGDNAKSTLVRLLNATLGDDYVVTVAPTFITRRRVASSNPTPEIASMKGSRLVVIQEPDEGESLQAGIIKETTGGDKIRARKLNDNGGPFIPTYQVVMQCNEIPEAQKQPALQSRMRIIPFKSKFVDLHDMPSEEECRRNNIFKKDPEFMSNIGRLATACLYYMVKYFEKFRSNPINKVPDVVREHTDTYWNSVDKFYQYINERLEWKYEDYIPGEPYYDPEHPFKINPNRVVEQRVRLSQLDLYRDYMDWLRDTGRFDPHDRHNVFTKVVDNVSRYLGKPTLDGWLGIQPRMLELRY